jgi:hypothetical protein
VRYFRYVPSAVARLLWHDVRFVEIITMELGAVLCKLEKLLFSIELPREARNFTQVTINAQINSSVTVG